MNPATLRKTILTALLAALLLALAAPVLAGGDPLVQIRVQGDGEEALIQVPMKVLEFLDKNQVGREFHACRMHGQEVTLSLGDMMKALQQAGSGGETVLMTVEEEGKKKSVTVGFSDVKAARPGKAPTQVVLSVRGDKAGSEPKDIKISVPLATVEAIFQGVKIEKQGDDQAGLLIRQLVPFARDLGTGLLARVVSDEGEVSIVLE